MSTPAFSCLGGKITRQFYVAVHSMAHLISLCGFHSIVKMLRPNPCLELILTVWIVNYIYLSFQLHGVLTLLRHIDLFWLFYLHGSIQKLFHQVIKETLPIHYADCQVKEPSPY